MSSAGIRRRSRRSACLWRGFILPPVLRNGVHMSQKPRTRFQRMHLAMELAAVIERNTSDAVLKEVASSIQLVLAAPTEMLSDSRLGWMVQLIHENSGNCCFKQRGCNWRFEDGIWNVAMCDVCRGFSSWPAALHAAMCDAEFRSLKPG